MTEYQRFIIGIYTHIAERWTANARYWMSPRSITGWQTVEFCADQAAACAREAARFSKLSRNLTKSVRVRHG